MLLALRLLGVTVNYVIWPSQPTGGQSWRLPKKGDNLAKQVIAEGAHILGTVLGGLMDMFDPQALIMGGSAAQLDGLWWMPFQDALRANPLPASKNVQIRRVQLGNKAVLVGAAWLAWEKTI